MDLKEDFFSAVPWFDLHILHQVDWKLSLYINDGHNHSAASHYLGKFHYEFMSSAFSSPPCSFEFRCGERGVDATVKPPPRLLISISSTIILTIQNKDDQSTTVQSKKTWGQFSHRLIYKWNLGSLPASYNATIMFHTMYELICAGLLCKTKNLVTVGSKNPLLTEQKEILNSGFQMSMPLENMGVSKKNIKT